MPGELERYNLRAIRDLLLDAFNADELQQLFYFAQSEELKEVVHQFREDDSLPDMVFKAVGYCERKSLLREMLAEVARANPRKYQKYEPRLRRERRTPARDAAAKAAERETEEQARDVALELEVPAAYDLALHLDPEEQSGLLEDTFWLEVKNLGNAALALGLRAGDEQHGCTYQFEPAELHVPVGGTASTGLKVRARAPLTQRGGRFHRFKVEVYLLEDPSQTWQTSGLWRQVAPALGLGLSPKEGRGPTEGEFNLRVNNAGDADLTVQLKVKVAARDGECLLQPAQVLVPAGGSAGSTLTIRPRAGVQGGRTFPFVVTAQAVEAPAATAEQQGDWIWTPDRHRPRKRIWPLVVAGALLVAVVILAVILSQDRTPPKVSISAEPAEAEVGQEIIFTAQASDNRELKWLVIVVDGEDYPCDPPHRKCSETLTFPEAGEVWYSARASDRAGNQDETLRRMINVAPSTRGAVTRATVTDYSGSFRGTCPVERTVNAEVETDGPAEVVYQWELKDGSIIEEPPPLSFQAEGSQDAYLRWCAERSGLYELSLHVTFPNDMLSDVAKVQVECSESSFVAPDVGTYTYITSNDIDTMDPNLCYDTVSAALIMNVMEGLIFFNRENMTEYVPLLAEEIPTVENGGISADGMTYTFKIRDGVTFHNGNDMTPSDFEYTFERGLIQSDVNGPQWLLIEPLLGYASGDITEEIADGAYAGDPEGLRSNATAEELMAVCEKAKASVESDDEAGTLTFNLAQPWSPWLATLAQSWGSVMDKEWAIENGAWDGSCETWQDYYSPGPANDELNAIINGTGPYMLQSWTPDEGWVLVANENYWREEGDEMWPCGPSGAPRIKRVVQTPVNEWGTRFAVLQADDAESITVLPANRPQVDEFVGEICDYETNECLPTEKPDAPLRRWGKLPSVSHWNIFMNFDLSQDEGTNPYIGSGLLDGNGIPPDFFTDIHVRKAFNYCFDYDAYISDALNGEGIPNNGPIIHGMLGYNVDGPYYEFDLEKCAEEMGLAWDGAVAKNGFRVQMAFNTGNTSRQTACAILQTSLASVSSAYKIECLGLPWPTMYNAWRAGQLPLIASGTIEDIHDPHGWAQLFTVGILASRQNLPDDLKAQFQEYVTTGVLTADPAEREQIYFELQKLFYDTAIQITLPQQTSVRYEQRWVKGYFYNPIVPDGYFYALDLASE